MDLKDLKAAGKNMIPLAAFTACQVPSEHSQEFFIDLAPNMYNTFGASMKIVLVI